MFSCRFRLTAANTGAKRFGDTSPHKAKRFSNTVFTMQNALLIAVFTKQTASLTQSSQCKTLY